MVILVFNFYPVTAIMIVMLALLNDGATPTALHRHSGLRSPVERGGARASGSSVAGDTDVVGYAAVYTESDLRDPVFHDNRDYPYGTEIKAHHNDPPGTDHRRRCDWCAQHDQRVAING